MLATRVGATPQAGLARAAALISYASSGFISKTQALVEETNLVLRDLFEKQLETVLIILLTPASIIALAFGLWRVGADLGWTGAFVIPDGFFSHWQVWLALAAGLRLADSGLQLRLQARAKNFEEN